MLLQCYIGSNKLCWGNQWFSSVRHDEAMRIPLVRIRIVSMGLSIHIGLPTTQLLKPLTQGLTRCTQQVRCTSVTLPECGLAFASTTLYGDMSVPSLVAFLDIIFSIGGSTFHTHHWNGLIGSAIVLFLANAPGHCRLHGSSALVRTWGLLFLLLNSALGGGALVLLGLARQNYLPGNTRKL